MRCCNLVGGILLAVMVLASTGIASDSIAFLDTATRVVARARSERE